MNQAKSILNRGCLRKCLDNPRYVMDGTGKAIYLTGSHTWGTFQDRVPYQGEADPDSLFDYPEYLAMMVRHHHNFLRMWCRDCGFFLEKAEDGSDRVQACNEPCAYVDVNTDGSLGNHPVYDLTRYNQAYFERLRERVIQAGEQGIYVSVMLFDAWNVDTRIGSPWGGHPYHKENNINGIDGKREDTEEERAQAQLSGASDQNLEAGFSQDTEHIRIQTLELPEVTKLQKAYIRKVLETLNDLDHVMYEICNEGYRKTKYWQYELVRFIHETKRQMPKQHPVWMSHLVQAQNEALYVSEAEIISVGVENTDEDYCINPPANDGRKIILADTDHLGGIWGTAQWAWKSFLRGLNPIFMDDYGMKGMAGSVNQETDSPVGVLFGRVQYELPADWREPIRVAMGQTRDYALRMNLNRVFPYEELSSTGYCLADPGEEYLIYQPESGLFKLKLHGAKGPFDVEWFYPQTGERIMGRSFSGSMAIDFTPPKPGEVVLYLKKQVK